jgi:hypothetical protein
MESDIQKLYSQIEFTKIAPEISDKAKKDLIEIYNSIIDNIQSNCKHNKIEIMVVDAFDVYEEKIEICTLCKKQIKQNK